jgi:hypothetical protein
MNDFSPISTAGYLFIIFTGILLLKLPRRYALIPLFMSGCYMTLGQVLLIGPLHFSIFRIVLLVGWIRVLWKNELALIKRNYIDRVLMAWIATSSLIYVLNRGMSAESIIYQLGEVYDTAGIYFLLRALILGMDDIARAVRLLEIIIVPLAILFLVEYATGKNIFSVFGGVPQYTEMRGGALRCQGPFRHPILAGTFAATAMPLFIGLWGYNHKRLPRRRPAGGKPGVLHNRQDLPGVQKRRPLLAASAVMASAVIVFCSSSSGPILAFLTGMTGLCFWVFRSKIKIISWGFLLTIIALQMTMKTPVWHVLGSMSDFIGMGTGWYRSKLIDAAVEHFNEWWLTGTTYTANWMPAPPGLGFNPNNIDANNADITNQFILVGVRGGLLSMLLFIWLLIKCFKTTGRAVIDKTNFLINERFIIWTIGCALLTHIASFISVTYFDQITIFWYMLIAMIAALANSVTSFKKSRAYCPWHYVQQSSSQILNKEISM